MERNEVKHVLAQFVSENGELLASPVDMPLTVTVENLRLICTSLMKEDDIQNTSLKFFVQDKEILTNLKDTWEQEAFESEKIITIIYQQQAIFQVRAVTRCTRYISCFCSAADYSTQLFVLLQFTTWSLRSNSFC